MSAPSEVLSDNPHLYWRLGESIGTTAEDFTTNNRDGTYNNTPTLGVTGALVGDADTAVSFDGTQDEHVRSNHILNTGTVSMEAWVFFTANPTVNECIATFVDGYGSGVYDKALYINGFDHALYFYVFDTVTSGGKNTSAPTNPIPIGEWVHVAGTHDGVNAYSYVNGRQVGSVASGPSYAGYGVNNIFVSGEASGSPNLTPRTAVIKIDEFVVYTYALNPARVLAHFEAGSQVAADVREGVYDSALVGQAWF